MSLQPVPIQNVPGVPDYTCTAFLPKSSDYFLLIPVINEGSRILTELGRAQKAGLEAIRTAATETATQTPTSISA